MLEEIDPYPQIDFLLNEGIDYVGIINKNGRLEHYICKNEISLPTEKREMFYMEIRLQNSMQRDFDEDFGATNYTLIERENSKFVSIPFSTFDVLAIVDKRMNHVSIVNKIKRIVTSMNNKQEPLIVETRSS